MAEDAGARLLSRPDVRRAVIDEEAFEKMVRAAPAFLRPNLIVAFDTGMREREILDLSKGDLKEAVSGIEAGTPENPRQSYGKAGFPTRKTKRPPRKCAEALEKK